MKALKSFFLFVYMVAMSIHTFVRLDISFKLFGDRDIHMNRVNHELWVGQMTIFTHVRSFSHILHSKTVLL